MHNGRDCSSIQSLPHCIRHLKESHLEAAEVEDRVVALVEHREEPAVAVPPAVDNLEHNHTLAASFSRTRVFSQNYSH